ncbi:MAG: hypothetical protein QXK86_07835 [Candidatus Bathyarchaeia archaeon]
MKRLKVNVKIIDKHKIFNAKGVYDPETRLLEVKKHTMSREVLRFLVDPDHIYEQVGSRRSYVVFVDTANRRSIPVQRTKTIVEDGVKRTETVTETVEVGQSIQVHSDDEPDLIIANMLDYHTERSFWKALIEKHRIPLSTLLIMLFAGMGVYLMIVTFLRAVGVHV